jgi:hypothetical protein
VKPFGRQPRNEQGRTKPRRATALPLPQNASPSSEARGQLSVSDIAAMIEHQIDHAPDDWASVGSACQAAVVYQVPMVVCRPEQVAKAALVLTGTGTQVATAIDFHHPGDPDVTGPRLRSEAQFLFDAGASELALTATRTSERQWAHHWGARSLNGQSWFTGHLHSGSRKGPEHLKVCRALRSRTTGAAL